VKVLGSHPGEEFVEGGMARSRLDREAVGTDDRFDHIAPETGGLPLCFADPDAIVGPQGHSGKGRADFPLILNYRSSEAAQIIQNND